MFPSAEIAMRELEIAGQLNPGPWMRHSVNVGEAARHIAAAAGNMDTEKAYVCGLMHDIGRRAGVFAVKHIVDGYDYAMSMGWDEVARVCLTHTYPVKNIRADIGRMDITPEQYEFVDKFIQDIEYDDYDRLIILCDALADANGFCILEKRFVDTTRRYGVYPFTIDRWNSTIAIKEYFEKKIGASIYTLLPGIEKCIYV